MFITGRTNLDPNSELMAMPINRIASIGIKNIGEQSYIAVTNTNDKLMIYGEYSSYKMAELVLKSLLEEIDKVAG